MKWNERLTSTVAFSDPTQHLGRMENKRGSTRNVWGWKLGWHTQEPRGYVILRQGTIMPRRQRPEAQTLRAISGTGDCGRPARSPLSLAPLCMNQYNSSPSKNFSSTMNIKGRKPDVLHKVPCRHSLGTPTEVPKFDFPFHATKKIRHERYNPQN